MRPSPPPLGRGPPQCLVVGAFSHTLFELDAHGGSGRSSFYRNVIQLHGSQSLLKVRIMPAEVQCVSNLDIGRQFHDADLRALSSW